MLTFIVTFLIISLTQARRIFSQPNHKGSNWAVLIAGSNGYYNYRHQSDIAHSYQILTKLGTFPPSNIITMMYDDVAWSDSNPFKGQLYNEPGGDDVHDGIHIDYKGADVTADNFLSVLQGIPIENRPELPVLNNTSSNDNIFVYFSDHGAAGLIAMPTGSPLYAVDLHEAFHYMHKNEMYNELVFYLEACESGSMFDNLLEDELSIFATTAADPTESSFAYYYNDTLGTYMADEYSIRWMQDTTDNWDKDESLIKQFEDVAAKVELSSPQKYGDESFEDVTIHDFEEFEYPHLKMDGVRDKVCVSHSAEYTPVPNVFDENWIPNEQYVDSRNVKLAVLQRKYLESESADDRQYWKDMVKLELRDRHKVDIIFDEIISCLYGEEVDMNRVNVADMNIMEWDCYKRVYEEFENKCGAFTDYSMKYVKYLAVLCQTVNSDEIIDAFEELCE